MEIELESVHLISLFLTVGVILVADHHAFEYLRGKRPFLSLRFVQWTHRLVWAGLIGMIVSGAFLAYPLWEYLKNEPAFYVKMGFVLTLCVNAFFIAHLSETATVRSWGELTRDERMLFLLSGSLSVIGWIGSAVIGFFFL
jgi:hypothetical protein